MFGLKFNTYFELCFYCVVFCDFLREEGCKEAIKKSRKVAIVARRCSDEFKAKCDIKISIHGTVIFYFTNIEQKFHHELILDKGTGSN